MTIAITDTNECNFAIRFKDESLREKVIAYMEAGLLAWYAAAWSDTDLNEDYDEKYFTIDEVKDFYGVGYAEPTCMLLDRENIKYELVKVECDEDGYVINADEVI